MLPKFEDPQEYIEFESLITKHSVYALIETPKGIISVSDIAKCSYVSALAFGAEDYTATVGMENDFHYLQYQKSQLVTYARAFGKKVYDTPSFRLNSYEEFCEEVDNARVLGFDGKMAIHPKHIEYINECYDNVDIDAIRDIVDEYMQRKQAVAVINGKTYEKMHIEHMKKILKESGE